MAREKQEEDQPDTGGWINTFADLMNLLLCFFVLLFSMSTVDADKYEQLVTSMTESINIFDGGGNAVGEGPFVSSGTDQVVSASQYFNEFENSGEDTESKDDQSEVKDGQQKTDEQQNQGAQGIDSQDVTQEQEDAVKQKEMEDLRDRTETMYSDVISAAQSKNVDDQISVNMDKAYQFVQISLNGGILFDSGSAEIKSSTKPLLSKVGDILKKYESHRIKIEGHTDNVKITGGQYKNNMWLSTARATEVFEYLVHQKNIKATNMEPTGCGAYHPIASNSTAKGRARNRRVEIKIYTNNE